MIPAPACCSCSCLGNLWIVFFSCLLVQHPSSFILRMSQPLFSALFDEKERRPLTVSELTNSVRITLESRFTSVWVEGEISNFKAHSSGHWYFTIKDEAAQLRAKCFRSSNQRIRFRPTDGLHVRARGKLTVFVPRG